MDIDAIEARVKARAQAITQSPYGLQMRPLALHLAFRTKLSESEALTVLFYAIESTRERNGLTAQEDYMRVQ